MPIATTTRTTILAFATLGLALGTAAWLEHAPGPGIEADEGSSSSAPRARRGLEGGADDGPCTFEAGARMAYDVVTRAHDRIDMSPLMEGVQIQGADLAAQPTQMDQHASRAWHVELEAIATTDDGTTVLAAHIDADDTHLVSEAGGRRQEGSQPPPEALGETFLVRVDRRCSIKDFGWRSEGDLAAAHDQQRLLAGLGWLAPRRDEASWTGTLLDPLGRVHVGFAAQGPRVSGRAVSYRETFGRAQGGERPQVEVVDSSIEVEPRAGEWLGSLSSARTLAMSMQGISLGTMESAVDARRAQPGPWRPEVSLDDGGWTWGLLLGQVSPRHVAQAQRSSALASVSVDEALAEYLARVHDGRSSAETVAYLCEWLRANPEGAGELVELLRAGAFEGEQSGSAGLFLALGKANTPQAADALLSIIDGPSDSMGHKISAAHALSKVESPTEAMMQAVVAVAERDDIHPVERGSLAMTLGTFASRNAERAPELAAAARDRIGGWLAEPGDTQELAGSLLAAGNTGHDELIPSIQPYLEHDDPQIRQRAARAMRHMSPEEAYPRLAPCMDDEDPTVRASAIETMARMSRATGVAPPESTVDVAIEQLDLRVPAREQKALLSLLGEASQHGNAGAQAVLQQHLADELYRGERDLGKLRALGAHTHARWSAESSPE